jgi:hypothetical protein
LARALPLNRESPSAKRTSSQRAPTVTYASPSLVLVKALDKEVRDHPEGHFYTIPGSSVKLFSAGRWFEILGGAQSDDAYLNAGDKVRVVEIRGSFVRLRYLRYADGYKCWTLNSQDVWVR